MPTTIAREADVPTFYDDGADELVHGEACAERVSLLPSVPNEAARPQNRIRILWGQDMLHDILDGRYRTVVCGVNDQDNARGIVAQLVDMIPTSQWSERAVTGFARMFQENARAHAGGQTPYVLKYDLDRLLILAILRPAGQDHFTLADLSRGFRTVCEMLRDRSDRLPVCSVSFLGARSNRLLGEDRAEPSFETVLRTMHQAGFRGDVYPSPKMWGHPEIGVFPHFPFPESIERMRGGSS